MIFIPTGFEEYTDLTPDDLEPEYVWMIEYILKNGEHVFGEYHGPEKDGEQVMNSLLSGDQNHFNGCRTADNRGSVCVRNGDISALKVTLPKGRHGRYR